MIHLGVLEGLGLSDELGGFVLFIVEMDFLAPKLAKGSPNALLEPVCDFAMDGVVVFLLELVEAAEAPQVALLLIVGDSLAFCIAAIHLVPGSVVVPLVVELTAGMG